MYTLYNFPGAGGVAVEAAMTDTGIPFQLINVELESDGAETGWFHELNPRGQVPALRLPDGSIITESAAMLIHLADAHPEANLAPPPGSPERAQMLRWLLFFAVNVYEGELRRHYSHRFTTNPDGAEGVAASAAEHVERNYGIFEAQLDAGPFFFGEQICVLDYFVWMLSHWVGDRTWIVEKCPRIERLTEAVRNRPAIAPLHQAQLA